MSAEKKTERRPPKTQKETIEYGAEFLAQWNKFCDDNGYVKRAAAHACRILFRNATAEQRATAMQQASVTVLKSRAGYTK